MKLEFQGAAAASIAIEAIEKAMQWVCHSVSTVKCAQSMNGFAMKGMFILVCSFHSCTRKIRMLSHAEHFRDTLPDCPDKAQHKAHREFTWIARKAHKGRQRYINKIKQS